MGMALPMVSRAELAADGLLADLARAERLLIKVRDAAPRHAGPLNAALASVLAVQAEFLNAPARGASPLEEMLAEVARLTGVSVGAMRSDARDRVVFMARVLFIARARRADRSQAQIGKVLGGRDSTTIWSAEQRLADALAYWRENGVRVPEGWING